MSDSETMRQRWVGDPGMASTVHRLAMEFDVTAVVAQRMLDACDGIAEAARERFLAAKRFGLDPVKLAEPLKPMSSPEVEPSASPSRGSEGIVVERLLRSLRGLVDQARAIFQHQQEAYTKAVSDINGGGHHEAYEAGLRSSADRLRLALATLQGAEEMLAAVQHGEQHGPPAKPTATTFAIDAVDDFSQGNRTLTLRADTEEARALLSHVCEAVRRARLRAVAHVVIENIPAVEGLRRIEP